MAFQFALVFVFRDAVVACFGVLEVLRCVFEGFFWYLSVISLSFLVLSTLAFSLSFAVSWSVFVGVFVMVFWGVFFVFSFFWGEAFSLVFLEVFFRGFLCDFWCVPLVFSRRFSWVLLVCVSRCFHCFVVVFWCVIEAFSLVFFDGLFGVFLLCVFEVFSCKNLRNIAQHFARVLGLGQIWGIAKKWGALAKERKPINLR